MAKVVKRIAIAALAGFMVLWCIVTVGGVYFTVRVRPADMDDATVIAGRPVDPVSILTEDGVTLSAWYVGGHPDRAVILLAGIDANRKACVGRAAFYLEEGYSVLLPDLRASGKSGGSAVTLGWRERKDLAACYSFLQEKGYREIGANGISLGAATICYALPELPDISFIVLESSYDTIANAVANRLAMFHTPHFIAWPYYVGLSFFTGTPAWRLRPLDFVGQCKAPAFIMAGDAEPELKMEETQSIFDRCASPLKELHFFKEGRHQDFLSKYPDEYRDVMRRFLESAAAFREQALLQSNSS